jgi:hypothetical protein
MSVELNDTPNREPTMCATLTKPARFARWLSDEPKSRLEAGLPAGLLISVGGRESYHWVSRVEGGWRVLTEREDGECEWHAIDASFGPEPLRDWTCDCGDYVWRARRSKASCGTACRHVAGLAAALRKIGL